MDQLKEHNPEQALQQQARSQWRQETQTKLLETFLVSYIQELCDNAIGAVTLGKSADRLLNKAKAVKEILDYVRTGTKPTE